MRFLNCLLIVLAGACQNTFSQGKLASTSVGEFLAALEANYSAIESFDVLVEEEGIDAIEGGFYDYKVTRRLAFHPGNNRLLSLKSARIRNFETGKVDDSLRSLIAIGDQVWIRELTLPQVRSRRDFSEIAILAEVFDPALIGVSKFPGQLEPDSTKRNEHWDFLTTSANAYGKGVQDADHASFSITHPFVESGTANVRTATRFAYDFDLRTLTPRAWAWGWVSAVGDADPRFHPQHREQYRWKELDGIFLPTQIDASSVVITDGDEGPRKEESMKTTKLTWLSVNRKMNEEMWQPDRWDDLDEIKKGCTLQRD